MNNLAILCMDQGRYVEASGLFRRVLVIYVKAYGTNHPAVADAMANLSQLERNRGAMLMPSETIARRWRSSKRFMARITKPSLAS